jgi:hypothetical protein
MKVRVIGFSTTALFALGVIALLALAMLGAGGIGPLA